MLRPKKSLGQNFLKDKNIVNKIIKLINNYKNKNIIEIGPGKGSLTEKIIKNKPKNFILIEKDRYLYKELYEKYKNFDSVIIYNEDALRFNFSEIKKPKSIIGNLPYNISIKLIINLLKNINDYDEIIVMIQKEVAQKMDYNNTKKMNRLNVLTALTSNYEIKFHVSKNVFFPKPKVFSSVIKITPKKETEYNFSKLEIFTRMLFHNKRKKIRNVLPKEKLIILKKNINFCDYDNLLNFRAEDLSLKEIIKLYKLFY